MTRRAWSTPLGAIATGLVVSLLAGCGFFDSQPDPSPTGESAPDLSAFYDQTLDWRSCDDTAQCATMNVPLKYDDPTFRSIQVEVLRRPATGKKGRLGALVLNPGGPGGSGIDYARAADSAVGDSVHARYDVVGFDPRGVGRSTPIDCMNNEQTDRFISTEGKPHSSSQEEAVVEVSDSVGRTCEENSPDLTPYVGTVPAARDMDILRAVLNEEKLNFLGKSYGTYLGLTYAELFPTKVGRFVLDGVIDPSLSNDGVAQGQADGFQLALRRFIANCPSHDDCPLPGNPTKAFAKLSAWLATLVDHPIKAKPNRPLNNPLAINAILGSMYEPADGWPALRYALELGFKGDGSAMLEIVDGFTGRLDNGTYYDNSLDALYAVNCLDRPDRADVARTRQLADEWARTAPTFGPELAWGNLPCNGWPAPATDAPHPIKAEGSGPIVLIGTTNDPATPYAWAVSTSRQLANAYLIRWKGDGHTAYGRGSRCVQTRVDAFLVAGTTPPKTSTC